MNLKDHNRFNSDFLDGKHASNSANNVPVLDENAKIPLDQLPTGITKDTVSLGNHKHDDIYDWFLPMETDYVKPIENALFLQLQETGNPCIIPNGKIVIKITK